MLLAISTTGPGTTYVVVRDTFDICTCAEESTLASEHSEDCVRVLIETAKRGDGVLDDVATEGVQCLGSVELREVRWFEPGLLSGSKAGLLMHTLIIPI
jgi:hypothetical protein